MSIHFINFSNHIFDLNLTHDFIMSTADDQYEAQNDVTGGDVPSGVKGDNDYASRTGQSHIPVQKDEATIEDPIDPATADSDETLRMYITHYCLTHLWPVVFNV